MTKFCVKCNGAIRRPELPGDEDEVCVVCADPPQDDTEIIKQQAYADGYATALDDILQGIEEAA